jgi:hypothetical protein
MRAFSVFLGLMLLGSHAGAEPVLRRFAIVIGNNRAEDPNAEALRYADDDALNTARVLAEAGVDTELLVTLDEDSRRLHPEIRGYKRPRKADLDAAFTAVSEKMRGVAAAGGRSELFLFYSGHGDVEHGEGYVVLEDLRLTRSLLYDYLAHSPASANHVFIDACKSYFLAFERGPGGRRSAYSQTFVDAAVPASLANTGFVLSTSSDRESHEWERYQAGILSHEVVSALRGAADADRDGRVSYLELAAFLKSANSAIDNPRFRPDFLVRAPDQDGHKVLLDWAGHGPQLALDGASFGHVYIEDAQGVRLLDAHPSDAQPLRLHVPGTRPLFIRQNDERAEFVLATAPAPSGLRLSAVRAEVASRGALHLAFERLFAAPFGQVDVQDLERRPRLSAAEEPAGDIGRVRRRAVRIVSGGLAVAGVAGGLTLNAIAYERYRAGAHQSQLEIAARNGGVARLNTASFALYGVALAAGAIFGATYAWPDATLFNGPTVSLSANGAAMTYQGRF